MTCLNWLLSPTGPWIALAFCLMAWSVAAGALWLAVVEARNASCPDYFRFDTYRALAVTCAWQGAFCLLVFFDAVAVTPTRQPMAFWISVYMGTSMFIVCRMRYHCQHPSHPMRRRKGCS